MSVSLYSRCGFIQCSLFYLGVFSNVFFIELSGLADSSQPLVLNLGTGKRPLVACLVFYQ